MHLWKVQNYEENVVLCSNFEQRDGPYNLFTDTCNLYGLNIILLLSLCTSFWIFLASFTKSIVSSYRTIGLCSPHSGWMVKCRPYFLLVCVNIALLLIAASLDTLYTGKWCQVWYCWRKCTGSRCLAFW